MAFIDSKKIYTFRYGLLKLKINNSIIELSPKLTAQIPEDIDGWEVGDPIIINLVNERYSQDNWELTMKNFSTIVYRDKIPLKGRYKWLKLQEKESRFKLSDCPRMVDSSLNTYEPPWQRNWFVYEKLGWDSGLSTNPIPWKDAQDFPFLDGNSDIGLHYLIICLYTKLELLKLDHVR